MATFRRRNGRWQVQIRRIGHPSISGTFTRKVDAEIWARQRELAIEAGDVPRPELKVSHSLAALLQKYKEERLPLKRSADVERYIVDWLIRHPLAARPLKALSSIDFARLRDERLRKVQASTLRRQFGVLRHALRTAQVEWGWAVPLASLDAVYLPPAVNRPITRCDPVALQRLFRHLERLENRNVAVAARLALMTGTRRGELLRLAWNDIDLADSTVLIRESKNGHPRRIPISATAHRYLLSIPRTSDRVVPISANCLKHAVRRACKAADYHIRFHDLRHEAISRFFDLGLSIPEVQHISGHRTMSQLSRYSHPDIKRLAAKLASHEPSYER